MTRARKIANPVRYQGFKGGMERWLAEKSPQAWQKRVQRLINSFSDQYRNDLDNILTIVLASDFHPQIASTVRTFLAETSKQHSVSDRPYVYLEAYYLGPVLELLPRQYAVELFATTFLTEVNCKNAPKAGQTLLRFSSAEAAAGFISDLYQANPTETLKLIGFMERRKDIRTYRYRRYDTAEVSRKLDAFMPPRTQNPRLEYDDPHVRACPINIARVKARLEDSTPAESRTDIRQWGQEIAKGDHDQLAEIVYTTAAWNFRSDILEAARESAASITLDNVFDTFGISQFGFIYAVQPIPVIQGVLFEVLPIEVGSQIFTDTFLGYWFKKEVQNIGNTMLCFSSARKGAEFLRVLAGKERENTEKLVSALRNNLIFKSYYHRRYEPAELAAEYEALNSAQ